MAEQRRSDEVLFEVAERALEPPADPAPAEKPRQIEWLRRSGRTAAAALPPLLIVALGLLNASLLAGNKNEPLPQSRDRSMIEGRESLAGAPGPDALGLRERFVKVQDATSKQSKESRPSKQKPRSGNTIFVTGPSSVGTAQNMSSSSPEVASAPSTKSKSSGEKKAASEPEEVPEPTAVLYRMFNSRTYDHHFTTNQEEKDRLLNEGYRHYVTEGIIFATQEKGTYPIHTDTGIVGYAFGKRQDNTVPLYYLRGPNGEGDLFTTSVETKEEWQLQRGWDYLGIAGYIGRWGPP